MTTQVNQHEPGAKLDVGKVRASLLRSYFPKTLYILNALCTAGAIKYASGGWKFVDNGIERYADAAERHALKRAAGEKVDLETICPHEIAQIWNLMASFELQLADTCVGSIEHRAQSLVDNAVRKWGKDNGDN